MQPAGAPLNAASWAEQLLQLQLQQQQGPLHLQLLQQLQGLQGLHQNPLQQPQQLQQSQHEQKLQQLEQLQHARQSASHLQPMRQELSHGQRPSSLQHRPAEVRLSEMRRRHAQVMHALPGAQTASQFCAAPLAASLAPRPTAASPPTATFARSPIAASIPAASEIDEAKGLGCQGPEQEAEDEEDEEEEEEKQEEEKDPVEDVEAETNEDEATDEDSEKENELQAFEVAKAAAAAEAMAVARKELLRERAKWREEQEQLKLTIKELESERDNLRLVQQGTAGGSSSSTAACTQGTLDLRRDGPWLARELGLGASPQRGKVPEIILDVAAAWLPLDAQLPAASAKGLHTQHFAVLFGARSSGALHLRASALCPEAFIWKPPAQVSGSSLGERLAALESDLGLAQSRFLAETFAPWACEQQDVNGEPIAAWLVCNDGEAFSISRPLLEFGQVHKDDASARWRSLLLVVDRAKSRKKEVAFEVMNLLDGGSRVLFDVS
eukprot:TRINITY_DN15028_c0_g1_i1.p1 TRINITY_DN15028_c0_g1~~TRINITY_DN15028_c0_g1_i1.p1  ORF type:complete len:496 (+),score=176.44 TRINITY_DN15028_c0_g1_i1:28-1515(+)